MLVMHPHRWDDPTIPLTIPNDAGRRAIVDVRTEAGERPFGFAVNYGVGELTVHWPGFVAAGDDLTSHPVPVPLGPLDVKVISNR